MADSRTLDIQVGADTGDAQQSIASLAASIEQLGGKLGGDLKKEAQDVAGKLRELGAQRDAINFFLQMQEQTKGAEAKFRELSRELGNYRKQVDGSTDPKHAASLQALQRAVDDSRAAWVQQGATLQMAARRMSDVGVSTSDARAALSRVRAELGETVQAAQRMAAGTQQTQTHLQRFAQAAGRIPPALRAIKEHADQTFTKIKNQVSSTVSSFDNWAKSLIGFGSIMKLTQMTSEMESVRVALRAVAGSTEEAGRQFDFVKRVANRAGADIGESAQQWMKLSAAAKGTALEGKATQDVFAAVTNAMSNLGRSGGETGAVLQTLTQIINGEDVSARQLERTLGTQLPGALQAAAKGFGVTEHELRRMLDAGEITAEKLLPALAKGLDDLYNSSGGAKKLEDALTGIKNAFLELADEFNGENGNMFAVYADIASAAITILGQKFIAFGKEIGAALHLLTTGNFREFIDNLNEIDKEYADKIAKAAQHNEMLRLKIEETGTEAEKAALAHADAAAKTADAGNAAADAAPQLEKLGMSYKQLDEAVAKVKDTQALELEVIKGRIKAAEEEIRQEGLSAEAKLAAQARLQEARKAEQDYYTSLLQQRGAALAQAQEQLAAEQAAAAASEEEKERRKTVIEQLQTLVLLREKDVQQAMEQAAAAAKNAEASSAEADAAGKALAAAQAKVKLQKTEQQATLTLLQAQKASAEQGEKLAQQMGNEYQARQYKIRQLELEVKITLAKAQAARTEAQGSIDVAKAQMAELRAQGKLTDAKKAELEASIRLAEAKLQEADAIKEGAALQELAVKNMRLYGSEMGQAAEQSVAATSKMAAGWNEVADAAARARGAAAEGDTENKDAAATKPAKKKKSRFDDGGSYSAASSAAPDISGNASAHEAFTQQFMQTLLASAQRATTGAAVPTAAQMVGGSTVNINLNGKRTTIGVANDADAHNLERLLREIANDAGRAA